MSDINNVELVGESSPQEVPETVSTKTSVASNPTPLPREENPVQTPVSTLNPEVFNTDSAFSFESDDVEQIQFSFDDEDITLPINLTPVASKEVAMLTGSRLDVPKEYVEERVKHGDNSLVMEAIASYGEDYYQAQLAKSEREFANLETPQDAAAFLKSLNQKLGRVPTFAEQRAAYAQHLLATQPKGGSGQPIDLEKLSPVLRDTVKKNLLSADMLKMQQEYDASVGYMDMALDFLEIATPTGAASEEYLKYTSDIYNSLDKLPSLPLDKQRELITKMVEAAKKQETFLFNNNNSIITGGQIDTMYNAILQGASLIAEGATDAEVSARFESAFNGTLFVGEVAAIGKDLVSVGKFLMRRIHSHKNLKDLVSEQERLAAALIDKEVRRSLSPSNAQMEYVSLRDEPAIVAKKEDVREGLRARKEAKGTRKERKQMEAEKRELGILEGEQKNRDISKEAKEIAKDKKIKFKQARKEVLADQKERLDAIERRKATVQERIREFDYNAAGESELSRREELLRQGRMTEEDMFRETGENFVLLPEGQFLSVPVRAVAHVSDTIYKFKPSEQHKLEQQKGLKGVQEEAGMSTEEVVERVLPTPSERTDIGWANQVGVRELNDLILADEELSSIGMKLGRELEKANGTSLTIQQSATGFPLKANDSPDSLGTFTFKLGDGGNGGFKTAEEATQAADNSLTGYPYRVVEEDSGFYVEMDVEHYINPYNDVSGMTLGKTPSDLAAWFLDHGRKVEEDLIKGLYALKGVNRSRVQKMEDKAKKAIKGLSVEENVLLLKMLQHGDAKGVEWHQLRKANADMEANIPEKVFKSYRSIREVYDEIYQIRERNYYQKLRAANMKRIITGLDEDGLGTPVKKTEVEGDGMVYDVETKTLRNVKDLGEGEVIVKLGTEIEIDGEFRTYLRVPPKNIKPLIPGTTLNRRAGHIDRMYRDAGYIVEVPVIKTIDGEEVVKSKVTHIVKTEAEAEKIASGIEGAKVKESKETISAEMDVFSDSENVQFGYGAGHLKKRGEIAKGSDGMRDAEVLNAFESMFNSIAGIQKALDYNVYQAALVKFNKTFKDYLSQGVVTRFEASLDDMRKRDSKGQVVLPKDKALRKEMINHHAYLKSLRQHARGEVFKTVDRYTKPMFNFLRIEPDLQEVSSKMQRLTSELWIVWNGLYQGVQNTVPMLYTIGTGGTSGLKAVSTLPAVLMAHLTGNKSFLYKAIGDEKLADELLLEMQNNGMIDAVGRSNDFLDLARKEGESVATTTAKAVGKGVQQAVYSKPRRALVAFQEAPIVTGNVLAYLTEFFELVGRNGKRFDGKAKRDISFQAQKRTQTQNSMNQFWYQSRANPASLAFQFMQAVHKGFLDWVIEPQWEVIRKPLNKVLEPAFNKHLGSMGKNVGRTADSWGKAFMATALTYTVFGPEGGLGKGLGSSLEDFMRSQYDADEVPFALDAFLDGGANMILNESLEAMGVDAQFDINATMSPSAFIDMLMSLVMGDFPKVNMLGASGLAMGTIADSVYNSGAAIYTAAVSEEYNAIDAANRVLTETVTNFKIIDTAHKAYIGYWTERNVTSRSLSGQLRVTVAEHIGSFLGLKSELQEDYYHRKSFNGGTEEGIFDGSLYAKKNLDFTLKGFADELVLFHTKKSIGLTEEEVIQRTLDLMVKWVDITKTITDPAYHDTIDEQFEKRALKVGSSLYDEYYKPFLNKKAYKNTSKWLNILEQKMPEGKAREEVRNMKEAYKAFEGK